MNTRDLYLDYFFYMARCRRLSQSASGSTYYLRNVQVAVATKVVVVWLSRTSPLPA